jgi:translation initiation factor 2 beta subunit (eIF-2beta)/eIF-5
MLLEEEEATVEEEEKEEKKPKITIEVKQTSAKEIQQIVKRFKKTNNPILSLFIAKKYYDMGNYNQSYNYALITNQIDNTIEDSWIIFAKSLVKLKQKGRAIKILQAYIDKSGSNKAKILLDNIKTGKFQ